MREQRLQRNLKYLVGFLGLLIAAGLIAVVVRIVSLASQTASTSTKAPTFAAPGGEIGFELPRGAKIVSMSVSGNRLAVHHDGPSGVGISILDLETGKRIVELRPVDAAPAK
ncbi:MAG: hypothetical protein ACKVP4_03715 [Hyphomicrobium sp.]